MNKVLTVKPIPATLGADHPEAPNTVLPKHEFSMGLIAPKGSGKTTLLINLMMYYKNYFNTIIVFSPTVKNDDKWDWVKEQPLLSENQKLIKWIKKLRAKELKANEIVQSQPRGDALEGLMNISLVSGLRKSTKDDEFDGKIPEDCFIAEYTMEDLENIIQQQQQMVELLHEYGQTKHMANRMLIIFDDMVGSSLFNSSRSNPFKKLNTNHRHSSASLLMVSQAYKEIQKTVRTNFTCLILFKIFNEKELEAIYEEYPMGMKKDQWHEAYDYCTEGEHAFMFYNIMKPPALRTMKNFTEHVFFK
jgi:energy-coupling factor transporter ATP-binding protein EcfA2